jgi:ankyrin repeat protein
MPALARRFEGDASIASEDLSGAFWNASHGGQLGAAQYLLARGAELNWPAPWSGQTPLDIAEKAECSEIVTWLLEQGATRE